MLVGMQSIVHSDKVRTADRTSHDVRRTLRRSVSTRGATKENVLIIGRGSDRDVVETLTTAKSGRATKRYRPGLASVNRPSDKAGTVCSAIRRSASGNSRDFSGRSEDGDDPTVAVEVKFRSAIC